MSVGEAEHLWESCRKSLRSQVSDAVWRSTFQDASPLSLDGHELVLAVPNALVKDRVEGRYLSLVEGVVEDIGGCRLAVAIQVHTGVAESEESTRSLRR